MAIRYGTEMALPFELAVITIVWIGLIPIGILMALWFRRARQASRFEGRDLPQALLG
jgi:hypothetical protein